MSASARRNSKGSPTNLGVILPLCGTAAAASAAYFGHALVTRPEWRDWLVRFATGPGRTSRLLLLGMVLLNWKSIPFVWTFRIFGTMIRHTVLPRKPLPRKALFHYLITSSYTPLPETDYNMHKSNSTYFSDLDASRSQLVMYLLGPGITALGDNKRTKVVLSPADGTTPVAGNFGVGLGAVFCSFRKELLPFQSYEMWSRVLSWDRKWFYIVTHFVAKGKVRPSSVDSLHGDNTDSSERAAGHKHRMTADWSADDEERLQKHVLATAVSKYVFKMGRLTVHPTHLLETSGLLPERPGEGWRGGGPDAIGDLEELDFVSYVPPAGNEDADWDWKRVEYERRRGMEHAAHFAALDASSSVFDGGRNGALGKFFPG